MFTTKHTKSTKEDFLAKGAKAPSNENS